MAREKVLVRRTETWKSSMGFFSGRFPAPHKDLSYLYEKMSGRGESAVLSPV